MNDIMNNRYDSTLSNNEREKIIKDFLVLQELSKAVETLKESIIDKSKMYSDDLVLIVENSNDYEVKELLDLIERTLEDRRIFND